MVLTRKLGRRCVVEEDENLDGVQENGTDGGEIDVTDLFEGEEEPPTKEQILAGVRKENEKGDEREKQDLVKANSIAMSVGLLIAGIIILVSTLVKDEFPIEIFLVVCGMQAAQSIFVGVKVRRLRKLYLTIGIIEILCVVFFAVMWILAMCGVDI